jgi:putative transposase
MTIEGLYKAEFGSSSSTLEDEGVLGIRDANGCPGSTTHRLLEPIGYIPPAEAEENYYSHLTEQAAIPS